MPTPARSIFLFVLLSVSLSLAQSPVQSPELQEIWTPSRIPASGAVPFMLYYQQFLRTNPFEIDTVQKSPEIEVKNNLRHRKAADLYTAMAKIARHLAESDDLLPAAPEGIEKKETDRIKGSWNLYPNVPVNATDLYQESLYMQYGALSHETALDSKKIDAMHEFVASLEKEPELSKLFQALKRNVCFRALSFAHKPLKEHTDKPTENALPKELDIDKKLSVAIQWFVPFVQKYPNEDNLKLANAFFETIDLYRSCYPDSNRTTEFVEPFRNALGNILNHFLLDQPNPPFDLQEQEIGVEYAAMYLGILRRWELLGKPMPIWGANMSGKRLDEKTLDGKVVLLDFWATWCGPCIAEFPHLKLLYQKYKDKGFEIISYSVDDDQEKLRDYLASNPLPWLTLSRNTTRHAGLPSLSHYYGAKGLPVVLLRDRSGNAILLDARGQALDDVLEILFE